MRIILYCISLILIYPLSILPFRVLYVISDLAYVLLFRIIGYRTKVVYANLKNSFPEKSEEEIKQIAKRFYHNFCDIIIENIKFLTISENEVKERCVFTNPEAVNEIAREGESAIITLGHCGNWDLAGLGASTSLEHQIVVFYRPLKNPYFDNLINKIRGRFGMKLIPDNRVRQMIREHDSQPNLYIFITDQTPLNVKTSYWTTFLNQDTPVFKGTEKMARWVDVPVFLAEMQRTRRGFYQITFSKIVDEPSKTQENEISEKHTRALESAIMKHPDNWLWSHRRWKRKRTVDIPIATVDQN